MEGRGYFVKYRNLSHLHVFHVFQDDGQPYPSYPFGDFQDRTVNYLHANIDAGLLVRQVPRGFRVMISKGEDATLFRLWLGLA